MYNLWNPPQEKTIASTIIFKIDKNDEEVVHKWVERQTSPVYPYSEAEQRWWNSQLKNRKTGSISCIGMSDTYNWHKHCSEDFRYPSLQDLNAEGCASTDFEKYPGLTTYTWAILTELTDKNFRPEPHQTILERPNSPRRYVLSFWALNRSPKNIHFNYRHEDLRTIRVEVVD